MTAFVLLGWSSSKPYPTHLDWLHLSDKVIDVIKNLITFFSYTIQTSVRQDLFVWFSEWPTNGHCSWYLWLLFVLQAPLKEISFLQLEVTVISVNTGFFIYKKQFVYFEACEEPLYVQDKVVIDVSDYANCNGKITTDKNHILVFSLVEENDFEQAFEFLAVCSFP